MRTQPVDFVLYKNTGSKSSMSDCVCDAINEHDDVTYSAIVPYQIDIISYLRPQLAEPSQLEQ